MKRWSRPVPRGRRPRRVILHCDADAFLPVERQLHPDLYAAVPALAVFQHGDAGRRGRRRQAPGVRSATSRPARAPAAGGGARASRGPARELPPRQGVQGDALRARLDGDGGHVAARVRVREPGSARAGRTNAQTRRRSRAAAFSDVARRVAAAVSRADLLGCCRREGVLRRGVRAVALRVLAGDGRGAVRARSAPGRKTGSCSVTRREQDLEVLRRPAADGVVVVAEQEDAGGQRHRRNKEHVDYYNVRSRELEFVSESALLCSTPKLEPRRLGNARVAERMRTLALANAADAAALVDRVAGASNASSRIVAATGVPDASHARANAARGVCDESKRSADGFRKKSVGGTARRRRPNAERRSPPGPPPPPAAAGSVCARRRAGRALDAVDAMAGDLAERVWDECEDEDGDGDKRCSRRQKRRVAQDARRERRDPRAAAASRRVSSTPHQVLKRRASPRARSLRRRRRCSRPRRRARPFGAGHEIRAGDGYAAARTASSVAAPRRRTV